jgi:hypothetical protein
MIILSLLHVVAFNAQSYFRVIQLVTLVVALQNPVVEFDALIVPFVSLISIKTLLLLDACCVSLGR